MRKVAFFAGWLFVAFCAGALATTAISPEISSSIDHLAAVLQPTPTSTPAPTPAPLSGSSAAGSLPRGIVAILLLSLLVAVGSALAGLAWWYRRAAALAATHQAAPVSPPSGASQSPKSQPVWSENIPSAPRVIIL
ncbi:MAG: hypothetical protein J7M17_07680 [Anaerolineae bacterium]|nr:hypothetical protein [Anaerolineae bacterium]